ncbi:hypothetical protein M407DRAFT_224097 [Tulasnella calospora MUT 4182]|uniref:F-box domain-containing protein n=1 Tax=Tulasnella calospora MUT 4182 TaxID=1051891 RepID=A0A0C3Q5X3_9AGAM|nr:hypothetical protein M407DRAFT_224097 [Tulasnella calospora MUT 4182]
MQLFPGDSMAKDFEDDMEYTKHLTISFSDHDHNQYQQLHPNLPSRAIFPNLTSIHFNLLEGVEGVDPGTMRIFLPSTVSLVRVRVSESAGESPEAVLGALAGTELPSFVSFAIETSDFQSGGVLGSNVSQVLHAHQAIETLSIDMGPDNTLYEVLCSAGRLPKLVHLDVIDFDGKTVVEEPEFLSMPHDHLFPVLRTLKLSGAPDFIDTLSSRVNPRYIETINLYLDTYDRYEYFEVDHEAQFRDSLLCLRRFARLRTLVLELGISISDEALNPVLECRELDTLTIVAAQRRSLWLREDSLVNMGKAWPQLKTMNLTLFFGYNSQNKYISLSHLRIIAREFRNLVKLAVRFDATTDGNEEFQFDDSGTMADNELRELDVTWSLIDGETEGKIVPLFRAWWPKLRSVTCETGVPYSRRWASVIKTFQKPDT